MNTLNDLIQNKVLFFSMISVIIATIAFIGYLIYRERKRDQEEIDDIMYSLIETNRKPAAEEIDSLEEPEEEKVQEIEKKPVEQQVESKKEDLNIEAMLEQMQQDLNAKAEDVVATFEQEQEENSIISYQELVKSLKGEVKEPVQTVVAEEPIKKDIPKVDAITKEEIVKELKSGDIRPKAEVKKFKNTDFISPVYGKLEQHLEYPKVPQFHKEDKEIEKELETYENTVDSTLVNKNIDDFLGNFDFENNIKVNSLEQTLDMPPISDEIKRNDEFLQALKEFRKNLD